jgi:peptidoglycan/LPS O-acetylase OafA/YrhL
VIPYLLGVATAFFLDEYGQLLGEGVNFLPAAVVIQRKDKGFNGSRSRLNSFPSMAAMAMPWWLRRDTKGTCLAILCAILAVGSMLVTIFLPYDLNRHGPNSTYSWSTAANVMYLTFGRLVWSIGLAIWVFLFATGRGGWIREMLSSPLWLPLARLTYQAYLVQGICIVCVLYMRYTLVTYSDVEYVSYSQTYTSFSHQYIDLARSLCQSMWGNRHICSWVTL